MKSNSILLSESQVVERILQLLRAFPDAGDALPKNGLTKAYWRRLFARNDQTRRVLELYRELPLLSGIRQPSPQRADWIALMRKDFAIQESVFQGGRREIPSVPPDFCPTQAREVIRRALAASMNLPQPAKAMYWREHFGRDEVIQRIRPEESNAYIPNPHRGTTTFQRFQGDAPYSTWLWCDAEGPTTFDPGAPVRDNVKFVPRTTLSYCRWPWRWFEPKKGQYNWKLLDLALKTARARGQTLQIRIEPFTRKIDYRQEPIAATRHPPEMSVDVPDWYWDTGAAWIERGPYHRNEPDFNDPNYLKHFVSFIRAAARRYDGHPDLESVDVAVAGKWGESGGNATPETKATLVGVFRKSFKKTQLIVMLGTRALLRPG